MIEEEALLSPSEEHAYRVLLRVASAGPEELAAAGVAPEAVAALRAKGLASAGPVVRPLPPDVALGERLLRRQRSLESARQALAALSEDYRASARRRDADHLVEIVVGRDALRERLRDLQDTAKEEVLWFCKANPLVMAGPDNAEENAALSRGVRYRAVYERALLEMPGELESITDGVRRGEEARTLPTLPVRLAIADRSVALCPLVPDHARDVGEATAALIRRSELLDALIALFESHWANATPVLTTGDDGPADADRLLLSLLVAGFPDKSIASQLAVSRRTVQRRLDRLMDLAGVDTRPGLAFQAARRGWL
ncbi:transcriptional regulator [Virgisporangium aliadipatigenens]|uniref:Transcriptional regulator n=1 Tax=Virgisporangium aliadipatigenens TaxID=741659 RepID=A0A8J3YQY8_9ACTN|nr:TrmB family transcriptional regulator [Virgisporangium aliadipatigenens]GIJ48261.1 transcriptional regulator [Virgisporangium aliadipatigenens]